MHLTQVYYHFVKESYSRVKDRVTDAYPTSFLELEIYSLILSGGYNKIIIIIIIDYIYIIRPLD